MGFITEHAFIIAEIGTGHQGSIDRAKKLIDAAQYAGADCVKFQIVYAEEILHPDTGFVSLPGGNIRLYERFRELEVSPEFYGQCKAYCDSVGILFSASAFGIQSYRELIMLSPAAIKIASPELNHFRLLQEIVYSSAHNAVHIPLILSSGVSKLRDIERAFETVESVSSKALLHCVTSYPAPEDEYNLTILDPLSVLFGIPVGVSDHSLDPVLVPVLSVLKGGTIIEKHICLSRDGDGLDDPVALPPVDFRRMVDRVRLAQSMQAKDAFAALESEFGPEKIASVLGSGVKKLSPSEKANYSRTNRSIHFMRGMKEGETISRSDIAILRTEKILTPGISPEFFETVVGARLVMDVQNGAGLEWEHLIRK